MLIVYFIWTVLLNHSPKDGQKAADLKLVWQEEFDCTGLPNPTKWDYEVGHIRNNEQQYYTSQRKDNAWVENGILTITGRKEVFANKHYKKGNANWKEKDSVANYTSASINTLGKASWKYGRIEIRAKLPKGKGIWPAIWMMGTNISDIGWPQCGEIDIMEYVGNHPKDIYSTVHYTDTVSKKTISDGDKTKLKKRTEFHIYAIEWNDTDMNFYLDDTKYHSFKIDKAGKGDNNPFRKENYLIINLAMGAKWPGPINDKILPQKYEIDYVRVYQ